MALAYRAGVPLKDMEFVQYHPTGLPGTGILITEAARAARAASWSTRTATATCRTTTSASRSTSTIRPSARRRWSSGRATACPGVHEGAARRAAPSRTPHGDVVHLDIRHLGEKKIDKKTAVRARAGHELRRHRSGARADPGAPVVHYMMGGIHTDIDTRDAARRACSPRANAPACRSTAPTGSARTR